MTLAPERLADIADRLAEARATGMPIARLLTRADATFDDGYAVQFALMERARSRGGGLRGFKIGTTSDAAMARVGVDEPMLGFLEHADAVPDGGVVDLRGLIAPRIEMELAFVIRDELRSADCDAEAALAATAYAMPAFEIIDSRYESGPFDPVAAVADNMSTARHVLGGERLDPRVADLAAVAAVMEKNGAEIARGTGANVLGHPASSLAWLVRALARYGIAVPAGSVVLTGGFADAVPAADGDTFVARFAPGGTVSCTFSSRGSGTGVASATSTFGASIASTIASSASSTASTIASSESSTASTIASSESSTASTIASSASSTISSSASERTT